MKILVVDDEALLVKGIRFNLQNEGYEVIRLMLNIKMEQNLYR